MNIGQIYETVLGWAGQKLGQTYATPIFDGASLDEINSLQTKQECQDLDIPICMMEEQEYVLINQQRLESFI